MKLHDLIANAVTWLQDDTDDGKSINSHHGYYTRTDEPRIRSVSISPRAAGGRPVFAFQAESSSSPAGDFWAPWTQPECDTWQAAIAAVTPVGAMWNGVGLPTFSVEAVIKAGNRATMPVLRYLPGCQECARTVFCRDNAHIWCQSFRRDPPEGWA